MIPPDVAARVRLLTQEFLAEQQPTVRTEAIHRLTPVTAIGRELPSALEEGALFRATIQRPLPNGTFLALVAGQEMTLAMDRSLKSGDTLELVVARREGNQIWAREATAPSASTPPSSTTGQPAAQTQWSPTAGLLRQLIRSALPAEPLPVPLAKAPPPAPLATTSSAAASTAASAAAASPAATAASSAPPTAQPLSPASAAPTTSTTSPLSTSSTSTTASPTPGASGSPFGSAPAPFDPTATRENPSAQRLPPYLAVRAALAATDHQLIQRAAPLTAQQLADTLRTSGLFYEAHLAQWVNGRYPFEELLREPQASPREATSAAAGRTAAGGIVALLQRLFGLATSEPTQPPRWPMGQGESSAPPPPTQVTSTRPATEGAQTPSNSAAAPGVPTTSSGEPTSAGPIPERLLPIVQRQLDALAQGRIDLLFAPWPGATARWTVDAPDDDPSHSQGKPGKSQERPWQSRLTVTSELLGPITFWLSVAPQGVTVAVAAAEPATEQLLRQRMHELLDHFAADALPLTQLEWRPFPTEEAG